MYPQASCCIKAFLGARYNDNTSPAFRALKFKDCDFHLFVASDPAEVAAMDDELGMRTWCSELESGARGVARGWKSNDSRTDGFSDIPVWVVKPTHVKVPCP